MALKRLFGSQLRADLLAALLLGEGEPTHVRGLAERIGGHSTNVSREVKMLAEEGVVRLVRQGRRVVVEVVEGDPLVDALRSVLKVATDPEARLRREVEALGLRVRESLALDKDGTEVLVLVSGPEKPQGLDELVASINASGLGPTVQARWIWEPADPSEVQPAAPPAVEADAEAEEAPAETADL